MANPYPRFTGTVELLEDFGIDVKHVPRDGGLIESGYFLIETGKNGRRIVNFKDELVTSFHKYPEGLTWEMVEASLKQDAWEFVRENYA